MNNQVQSLRVPPNSVEAENAFLSAVLERNSLLDDVEGALSAEDFYRHENQILFTRMLAMAAQGRPIDAVTLHNALSQAGESDAVSDDYIVDIATTGRGASNAMHYARIIRDRSTDRQLIRKGWEIAEIGYSEGESQEKIDKAQSLVMESATTTAGDIPGINIGLQELVARIDRDYRNEGEPAGLRTGYDALDKVLSGLQPGDLIVIAGRPSHGKTTLAMNIVENAVVNLKKSALVFSLEMPRIQILARMASSLGRIPLDQIRSGKLDENAGQFSSLTKAIGLLKDTPLFIDDRPMTTSEQLFSRARKTQKRHGKKIDVIVVDYLTLLKDKGEGVDRVTRISGNLKALAREMDCPVIAISQLSRECEKRPNKRPINSDIRDSGAIEQDADVIAFVYRDEVYNEDTPDKGIAEIIISKHRNGEIGTQRLASNLRFSRFDNLEISRVIESQQRQQSKPAAKQGGRFSYADY
jgi:replicative DNA helicase